jgi:hypothetical protein
MTLHPDRTVIDGMIRAVAWQPRRALLLLLLGGPVVAGGGLRLLQGRWDETAVVMTAFVTLLFHVVGITMAALGPPVVNHPLLGALGTSPLVALPTRSHGWVAFFAHGVLLERVGPLREARYFSRGEYPALRAVDLDGDTVTLRIETVQGGGRHGSASLQRVEEKLQVDPAVLATHRPRLLEATSARYDPLRPAVRQVNRALVALGATVLYVGLLALAAWAWVA